MTTIDAAAAWRGSKFVVLAVLAVFVGTGLGGCETSNPFAGGGSSEPSVSLLPGTTSTDATQGAKIAIAPVIGAPENVAKQLQTQLSSAIEAQKVSVAKGANDKAEFTLRGYVVSAREKGRTKVSYIWDVTDGSGRRVNRITGEEVLAGAQSSDPWAAVTPQVVDTISNKTAGSLVSWLPTQNAAVAMGGAQTGAAAVQPVAAPGQGAPAVAGATAKAAATPANAYSSSAANTPTGSIARDGKVNAMIPSVVGAPGDGSVALTNAIQRELQSKGVALTNTASAETYRVEGKVSVGAGQNGKQPIQIDWSVKDPKGKNLGTVSQKNEIPQGSLDGAWGKTADAAAAAAAQGILKLLPQTQVN